MDSPVSALPIDSDAPAISPYVISDWERKTYYSGISSDPPELLYRSDLLENPYPVPEGTHPDHLPEKTVHGIFYTPLSAVWEVVLHQICAFLKARQIRFSTVGAVRFVTHWPGEDKPNTRGPIVIWISTRPGTITAKDAHDASPGILALIKDHGVDSEGMVVEWREGVVERL